MSRSLVAAISIGVCAGIAASSPASAYEIKPKIADSGFASKTQPDIVGLSSDTEGSKAGSIFEAYLKELPGIKPKSKETKFGSTNISYITSMAFDAPASKDKPGESLTTSFSSPASGNRAYYISRTLGFASDRQPSKAEMIERVTKKYGTPTVIGDGHLYYFYKAGKTMSVKEKYDAKSSLVALDTPINPKAAVALNDANGRGSCVAVLKRAQASDKSLDALAADAKAANCDALVNVMLSPGITPDRAGKADFTLIDFKRIVSAAKIDADALAAEKSESVSQTPSGSAPKL